MIRIYPLMLQPNAAFYELVARVHAGADSSEAWFTGPGMVVSYHPSVPLKISMEPKKVTKIHQIEQEKSFSKPPFSGSMLILLGVPT